jgi:hypothetical protein
MAIATTNPATGEVVKASSRLPRRKSSKRRELAKFGIREFLNIKTVWAQ